MLTKWCFYNKARRLFTILQISDSNSRARWTVWKTMILCWKTMRFCWKLISFCMSKQFRELAAIGNQWRFFGQFCIQMKLLQTETQILQMENEDSFCWKNAVCSSSVNVPNEFRALSLKNTMTDDAQDSVTSPETLNFQCQKQLEFGPWFSRFSIESSGECGWN